MFALCVCVLLFNYAAADWPSALTGYLSSSVDRARYWIAGAEASSAEAHLNYNGATYVASGSGSSYVVNAPTPALDDDDVLPLSLPVDGTIYHTSRYFRGTRLPTCIDRLSLSVSEAFATAESLLNSAHDKYHRFTLADIDIDLLDEALAEAACSLLIFSRINAAVFPDSLIGSSGVRIVTYPAHPGFTTVAYEEGFKIDRDFNDYVAGVRYVEVYGSDGAYLGTKVSHIPLARGSINSGYFFLLKGQRERSSLVHEVVSRINPITDHYDPFTEVIDGSLFSEHSSTTLFAHAGSASRRALGEASGIEFGRTYDFLPLHTGLPRLQDAQAVTNTLTEEQVPRVYARVNHTLFVSNDKLDKSFKPTWCGARSTPGLRLVLAVSNDGAASAAFVRRAGRVLNLADVDRSQSEKTTLETGVEGFSATPIDPFKWMEEGYPIDTYKVGKICVQSTENLGKKCASSNCPYGFCVQTNVCMFSNGNVSVIGQFSVPHCDVSADSFCKFGVCFSEKTPYYGLFSYLDDCYSSIDAGQLPEYCGDISSPVSSPPQTLAHLYLRH